MNSRAAQLTDIPLSFVRQRLWFLDQLQPNDPFYNVPAVVCLTEDLEHAIPRAAITDRSPHSPAYKRHRPEQTLLYQNIERHYPAFRDVMAAQGKSLPLHVHQEFIDYLKCGWL